MLLGPLVNNKLLVFVFFTLLVPFDTIDHSILIERLSSRFGISGTVLNWIKSYISSRSFHARIKNSQSSVFQLFYGVSHGSVLGPLLITLYTTPLSTAISQCGAHHHLYAYDTQLFISFTSSEFVKDIAILENTNC
jgi:Reverse transcriptase (RNA-dependent DNA polymerase)